jgi:hypothetical protein
MRQQKIEIEGSSARRCSEPGRQPCGYVPVLARSGEMEVIEATIKCLRRGFARDTADRRISGYTAYRPRHIEEGSDLSAAEVEQICYGETGHGPLNEQTNNVDVALVAWPASITWLSKV